MPPPPPRAVRGRRWAWVRRFHLPEAEKLNGRAAMVGARPASPRLARLASAASGSRRPATAQRLACVTWQGWVVQLGGACWPTSAWGGGARLAGC